MAAGDVRLQWPLPAPAGEGGILHSYARAYVTRNWSARGNFTTATRACAPARYVCRHREFSEHYAQARARGDTVASVPCR